MGRAMICLESTSIGDGSSLAVVVDSVLDERHPVDSNVDLVIQARGGEFDAELVEVPDSEVDRVWGIGQLLRPAEARVLAAVLLNAADEVDAHRSRLADREAHR